MTATWPEGAPDGAPDGAPGGAGGEERAADAFDPFAEAAKGGADGEAEPGGTLLSRSFTIRNQRGLHARAAAKFVKIAETFAACVTVRKNGNAVSGRSIMGLMMLGAGQGCEVIVEAEGWDAREALDALAGLVEAGFHED
jgi:phosphocarrier protein HPr